VEAGTASSLKGKEQDVVKKKETFLATAQKKK